jgi:hypothetical protein
MAEEINQLLKIEIDQKTVNDAINAAAKARQEIDRLRQANKELDVTTTEGAKAIAKNSAEIKRNSAVVRENEKIVTANDQINQENIGTIDKLRKQLQVTSIQWKNLNEEERNNEEIGGKLAKQKKALTDALKAEEKATGDTRRNVGNYREDIEKALQATGGFGQSLMGMVSGLKAATAASLKFLATPLGAILGAVAASIGLVVGAFKTLQASLQRTEKGQAALSKVFSTFRGLANGLLKVIEPLAEFLAEGLAIGFQLVTDAVLKASRAIASALEFLGLDSWADGLNNAVDEIERVEQATNKLVDAERELNQIRREQDKLQLEFQKRAEKLRQIRDDESLSIQERIEANRELGKVLDEQQAAELAFAERSLEIAQLRVEAEGDSTENLDAIAEAELKIAEIQERIVSQRSEQLTNENALIKEARDARLEAIAQEEARIREFNQAQLDELERFLNREEEIKAEFEERAIEVINDEQVRLKEQFAQGLIDRQAYEEGLLEIEAGAREIRRLAAEIAIEEANNNLEISEAERVRIVAEAEREIIAIRGEAADAAIAANQKVLDATKKIDKTQVDNKSDAAGQLVGLAQGVAGEETAVAKVAGVAQATISTYAAASKALAQLGFPAGIAAAALITAKGLANVAKITSVVGVGFADGGYTGDGYGKPDSSGYKPAGIVHEGEYVVKKSIVDNPNFAPIISHLENVRLKGYADGGFVGRSASAGVAEATEIGALRGAIASLENLQPIVRVTDINRVGKEAQMVKVSGALT